MTRKEFVVWAKFLIGRIAVEMNITGENVQQRREVLLEAHIDNLLKQYAHHSKQELIIEGLSDQFKRFLTEMSAAVMNGASLAREIEETLVEVNKVLDVTFTSNAESAKASIELLRGRIVAQKKVTKATNKAFLAMDPDEKGLWHKLDIE